MSSEATVEHFSKGGTHKANKAVCFSAEVRGKFFHNISHNDSFQYI